jgi:hypothetical protein
LAKTKWWLSTPARPTTLLLTSFLFPEMNQDLKRKHTPDVAEAQRESLVALDSISVEDFR